MFTRSLNLPYQSPQWRRGFSFTEILFAVVILGIGFIMVAAIFPVAIQQGKTTSEETVAASVARDALSIIQNVATNSDANTKPFFPATGTSGSTSGSPATAATLTGNVWSLKDPSLSTFTQLNTASGGGSFSDQLWNRFSQSLVVPSDQRYAFVGLYRRDGDPADRTTWSPFAQVWFVPVTTRNRSFYGAAGGTTADTTGTRPNLVAKVVQVEITDSALQFNVNSSNVVSTKPTGTYVIRNYTANSSSGYSPSAMVTGCYVIIARDNNNAPTRSNLSGTVTYLDRGRMNGRIFHVGNRRPDLDGTNAGFGAYQTYELTPDGDFVPDPAYDAFFNPGSASDDIFAIGNTTVVKNGSGATLSAAVATAPADAYIIGADQTTSEPSTAQDVSAFTTFVKCN